MIFRKLMGFVEFRDCDYIVFSCESAIVTHQIIAVKKKNRQQVGVH